MLLSRCLAFIFCLLFAHSAFAHKLNVFTFVEGEQVFVEGYFADGKRAKNSQVKVYNEQREVIAEGTTNDAGEFNFKTPVIASLRIHLDAGMGHAAEYTLAATEFSQTNETVITSQDQNSLASNNMQSTSGGASQDEIKIIVDQAVSSAVKPLVREISELKNKTSLSDIIGGLGFILGALGLFAYLKARKPTS